VEQLVEQPAERPVEQQPVGWVVRVAVVRRWVR